MIRKDYFVLILLVSGQQSLQQTRFWTPFSGSPMWQIRHEVSVVVVSGLFRELFFARKISLLFAFRTTVV